MKSELVLITAIICLCILGVIISCTQPDASKMLYAIVGIIAAIAGVGGTFAVNKIVNRLKDKREK